jgi:hypothetical protein
MMANSASGLEVGTRAYCYSRRMHLRASLIRTTKTTSVRCSQRFNEGGAESVAVVPQHPALVQIIKSSWSDANSFAAVHHAGKTYHAALGHSLELFARTCAHKSYSRYLPFLPTGERR